MKKKLLILLVVLVFSFVAGIICSPFVPYILRTVFFEESASPEMALAMPQEMTERAETRAIESTETGEVVEITSTETPIPTFTSVPTEVPTEIPTEILPTDIPTETPTSIVPSGMVLTSFGEDTFQIAQILGAEVKSVMCTELGLTSEENAGAYSVLYIPIEVGITDVSDVEGMTSLSWEVKTKLICLKNFEGGNIATSNEDFDILLYAQLYKNDTEFYSKYFNFSGDFSEEFKGSHVWSEDPGTVRKFLRLWLEEGDKGNWTWDKNVLGEYLPLRFVSIWSVPKGSFLNTFPSIYLEPE